MVAAIPKSSIANPSKLYASVCSISQHVWISSSDWDNTLKKNKFPCLIRTTIKKVHASSSKPFFGLRRKITSSYAMKILFTSMKE